MLDPGQADAIARSFGLGGDPRLSVGPVARGKQGEIWQLDTSLGRWAVKESFRRLREAEVADAVAFQEAVAAAGVGVPSVIRTADGDVLADIDDPDVDDPDVDDPDVDGADVGGAQVRVFGWVDLLAPDITADPQLVGRTVAGIHRVRRTTGDPFDEWYGEPVGAGGWDELVRGLRGAGAQFAESLAHLRDELVALEDWMTPPRHLQTCHRDLWADNLRRTPGGDLCVIDWEGSGPDPDQELACVLFEFGSADARRAHAVHRAYVDAGGPGRVDTEGCFSMLIAQLGHIAQAACREWLHPTLRSSRADSAAAFAEFVDRPHDRGVLGRILDAVTE